MRLFEKRPLASMCACLLGGMLTVAYIPNWVGLLPTLFALLALLSLPCFAKSNFVRRYLPRRRTLFIAVCMAAVLCGQAAGFLSLRYPEKISPDSEGEQVLLTLRVEEICYESDFSTRLYVKTEKVNGEEAHALAVWETEENLYLSVGDRVTVSAIVSPIQNTRVPNDGMHLRADGITARITDAKDLLYISHESSFFHSMTSLIEEWRDMLGRRLAAYVPGDAGSLMRAMLLGEREVLGADVQRDFRRVGLTHILALSGLHLSLLAGGLAMLLRHLRVRRPYAMAIEMLLLLFYVLLTGASLSILRASGMLLLSMLGYFAAREPDGLTSLFVAAVTIVLLSPCSLYDIGFLLSFVATFAILTATEFFPYRKKEGETRWRALLRGALASLTVSFAAFFATLPLTVLFFGEFSLLALPANLLLAPPLSLYLMLAPLVLLFGFIPYFGTGCALFGEGLLSLISFLSRLPMATVDVRYLPVILLLFSAVALLFFVLCVAPSRRRILAFAMGGMCALALTVLIIRGIGYTQNQIYLSENGKDEALLILSKNRGLLWDMTDGTYSDLDTALALMEEAHLTELDGLALSHYHRHQPATLKKIAKRYVIRHLYLPTPQSEEDALLYEKLSDTAREAGIAVTRYVAYESINFHAFTLIPHATGESPNGEHPTLGLTVSWAEKRLTYLCAASHESSTAMTAASAVDCADILIFGKHGPPEKTKIAFRAFSSDLSRVYLCDPENRLPAQLYAILSERDLLAEERVFSMQ